MGDIDRHQRIADEHSATKERLLQVRQLYVSRVDSSSQQLRAARTEVKKFRSDRKLEASLHRLLPPQFSHHGSSLLPPNGRPRHRRDRLLDQLRPYGTDHVETEHQIVRELRIRLR